VNATPMMTIDILPTLATVAGAALPKLPIDGRSILPQLKGQRGAREPHDALYFYWDRALQAVRSGKWKLHFPHPYFEHAPANGGKRGIATTKQLELSLYDLEQDIGEQRNVAAQNPEVVKRLQALAETMRSDLGDSLTAREASRARAAGKYTKP
jgi:arylsulfatase A-like enzyme